MRPCVCLCVNSCAAYLVGEGPAKRPAMSVNGAVSADADDDGRLRKDCIFFMLASP